MNAKEFALATGFTAAHIQLACRRGEIKCDKVGKGYEIPPSLIPVWRARKNIPQTRRRKSIVKCSRAYQNALDVYNRVNGTDYSYGQAVALEVLTNG